MKGVKKTHKKTWENPVFPFVFAHFFTFKTCADLPPHIMLLPMNKALENLVRPHLKTMAGYVSAGMEVTKSDDLVFMNANENPFMLEGVEGFNRYPEPQPAALIKAYATAYGVKPEYILATRGADEAIKVLIQTFCEPGNDSILIHPPTFGIYTVYASGMGLRTVEVPLIKDANTFKLDVEGIIAAAKTDRSKLVFLCSPNNPTGTSFPRADLIKIITALEGISVIIIDEAYAEFSKEESFAGKLEQYPNLIVLRTLSKSYGLAGERLGSALCADADFINLLKTKVMETYPISKSSIEAGLKALSQEKAFKANIEKLLGERDRMRKAFESSSLVTKIYESDANFLMVEMKDAKGFADFCAANNFILRDFSSKKGSENALRISPGTPAQNDQLFELMKRFARDSAAA